MIFNFNEKVLLGILDFVESIRSIKFHTDSIDLTVKIKLELHIKPRVRAEL